MQDENPTVVGANPADNVQDGAASSSASSQDEPLAAVIADRDRLAVEKSEMQDAYLRLRAEFDNYRRRADRERVEFAEYAGSDIVRSLLTILDDFERALKAAKEGGSAETELVKGIELIHSRLFEALKKQGLEPISTEGAKFDPHLHHAVQMVPSDEGEDGTILEVYQRGYNFKEKQLRPAMVKVAVKS